jgi:histidinol-phosphate phosphatase family protein
MDADAGKRIITALGILESMSGFLVFLDRDGTIIDEADLLCDPKKLRLIHGAAEGIKLLNSKGVRVAIVTNQPVVARGLCSEDDVKAINSHLLRMLKKESAKIDAVYYCPHHPEKNHPEANDPKYRRECGCRKPKTGMLEEASRRFGIPSDKCFMIGDSTRDVQTARNFNCVSILVKTGYGGNDTKFDAKPDHVCKDLLEAAKLVVSLI